MDSFAFFSFFSYFFFSFFVDECDIGMNCLFFYFFIFNRYELIHMIGGVCELCVRVQRSRGTALWRINFEETEANGLCGFSSEIFLFLFVAYQNVAHPPHSESHPKVL